MKLHILILTSIILTVSCNHKEADKGVSEFESVLGLEKTESLNLLVSDFEQNLNKLYPNSTIQESYESYLNAILSNEDGEKLKFQTELTNSRFHESGLWDEIYIKDSVMGLTFNHVGKYIQALYAIEGSDIFINNYREKKQAAGMIPNVLLVKGLLTSDPDFNNYFHKRIVVLEFSF